MGFASHTSMKTSIAAKLTLIALFIALPVSSAISGELSTVINGKSFHLNASEDWNEDNFGFGLEYEFASESRWKKVVMANGFRDSNEQMSYMAGGGIHRNLFQTRHLRGLYLDAGLNAFLMTREDVNDNRPFPGALPSLTIGNRYLGFNLSYLPKTVVEKIYDSRMRDESIKGIVFVQFKVRVGEIFAANHSSQ